jgi:hypothetical protein
MRIPASSTLDVSRFNVAAVVFVDTPTTLQPACRADRLLFSGPFDRTGHKTVEKLNGG